MKGTIIRLLSFLPLGFLFKPRFGGIGTILFMHKVVAGKSNEPRIEMMAANEIEVAFLEQMIHYLQKKGYEFLSLDDLGARLESLEKSNKKFIVFTFDDGYRDNLSLALPVFEKYGVPFTIYITNGFPNKTARLWWYMLEDIVLENSEILLETDNGLLRFPGHTQKTKERSFQKLRKQIIQASPEVQGHLIDYLERTYHKNIQDYVNKEALNWEDVAKLSAHPLVSIGGHTMNHITLNKVPEEKALEEVMVSKKEIEKYSQGKVVHFAYPFGTPSEVNQPEIDLLERSGGFETATTTRMGNIFKSHQKSMLALPRIQVLGNQQKLSILNLYLSGVLPAIKNKFRRVVTV